MTATAPNTITHDAAARVLKLTPGELTKLVNDGQIQRVSADAYVLLHLVHGYIDHLRAEQQRIIQRPLQAEIADHLDVSDRRVRELAVEWGIDSKSISLAEWRVRYIRHLREQAAGRATEGDLDLATERARLAKEQADKIGMQNAITRRELAPSYLLEEVLAAAGAKVAAILDAIPGAIRRRNQNLTAADIETIASEIAKARNIAAAITLEELEAEAAASASAAPAETLDA
jgi:phage terminase Nu1 subunit (DNA packaging protein)